MSALFVLTNALQAMGAATQALIINISRQGLVFIPAVFILKAIFGMNGVIWAQPVADLLSLFFTLFMYSNASRKIMRKDN